MSGNQVVGGVRKFQAGGITLKVKSGVTYNLGGKKREPVVGLDGVHGHSEKHQSPFAEATFTDDPTLDMKALQEMKDATVTIDLANGKTILIHQGAQTGDCTVNADEGEFTARFDGVSAEEIAS